MGKGQRKRSRRKTSRRTTGISKCAIRTSLPSSLAKTNLKVTREKDYLDARKRKKKVTGQSCSLAKVLEAGRQAEQVCRNMRVLMEQLESLTEEVDQMDWEPTGSSALGEWWLWCRHQGLQAEQMISNP